MWRDIKLKANEIVECHRIIWCRKMHVNKDVNLRNKITISICCTLNWYAQWTLVDGMRRSIVSRKRNQGRTEASNLICVQNILSAAFFPLLGSLRLAWVVWVNAATGTNKSSSSISYTFGLVCRWLFKCVCGCISTQYIFYAWNCMCWIKMSRKRQPTQDPISRIAFVCPRPLRDRISTSKTPAFSAALHMEVNHLHIFVRRLCFCSECC